MADNATWTGNQDFYPRPPRGGRPTPSTLSVTQWHFYPRPPRGGRQRDRDGTVRAALISIHALRKEGDDTTYMTGREAVEFLPTPSARRATLPQRPARPGRRYFYPRPPRGGRRNVKLWIMELLYGSFSLAALFIAFR